MRDHLNLKVKHREIFRPFAPVILEEKNKEYFNLKQSSPFMLLVAKSYKPSKYFPQFMWIKLLEFKL